MQFRAAAEIRFRGELLVGSRSVEQTLLGGSKKNAESSGGSQVVAFCHQTSASLINQKQIRLLLLRQLNRFTFPRVEIGKRSIRRSRRPPALRGPGTCGRPGFAVRPQVPKSMPRKRRIICVMESSTHFP